MKPEVIRVEPLSSYLENWKALPPWVTRHGNTIYVSGLAPFDPATARVAFNAFAITRPIHVFRVRVQ